MAMRQRVRVPVYRTAIALGCLALFLAAGGAVSGQETSTEKGKGIYQRLCTACHGKAGKGEGYTLFDPPPADLQAPATQKKSDEELLEIIRNGHPNTAMGTWKYALSEQEIQDVLAYLRQFGKEK